MNVTTRNMYSAKSVVHGHGNIRIFCYFVINTYRICYFVINTYRIYLLLIRIGWRMHYKELLLCFLFYFWSDSCAAIILHTIGARFIWLVRPASASGTLSRRRVSGTATPVRLGATTVHLAGPSRNMSRTFWKKLPHIVLTKFLLKFYK
jgi:dolichol kinase